MSNADRGWIAIFAFAAAHNIVAAGRGKEMLSQAARRHRKAHPVLVPAAAGLLLAHLMGWLHHHADPLYHLGAVAEKLGALVRG